ncbi:O-antigen ligase family protein [Parasphingorhabdus halotolerans]|uniref:O-antigen polymerase n=1 Tax=Parasphingorhabdus halotolerans TaxID=2725558 RepID=A0A6H2DN00_9SPHN|nr:O-antigen ligase family protein [Parasphingorhabdus halotolerans]QJB69760.1 O-antigen polymerase [Parasphingorhabdus halotolerans]
MSRKLKNKPLPYFALVGFLILTFITGGGSRADIQSLVILRPAAIIMCALALLTLKLEHIKAYRYLFVIATIIFLLVGSHLVPLPPSIWRALPSGELVSKVYELAGIGEVWRPLSMVPSTTLNAFYSLFVPLAVLLLGSQISAEESFSLLPFILIFGLLSAFVGLLQIMGAPDGSLYFYRITNNGSAVGLFSNRNHQAILLAMLFPMLAVYASAGGRRELNKTKFRNGIMISAGAVLIPLLLVTGSRAGLVLGTFGLMAAFLFYSKSVSNRSEIRKVGKWRIFGIVVGFGTLSLGAITALMSRGEALQRLFATDQTEDLRFKIWPIIVETSWKYFPTGSGIGSFVEVYQIDEPYNLLARSYVNHAHNDWLEVFMTAGLPGLLILLFCIVAFAIATYRAFVASKKDSSSIQYMRLGAIMVFMLALGSIGDYPLRTPSLSCLFVIASIWMIKRDESGKKRVDADKGLV